MVKIKYMVFQNKNKVFKIKSHINHVAFIISGEHGLDLSTFQTDHKEGCVWDVYNVTTGRRLMPSENADPNYAVLTFGLSLARKRVFLTYILTLPCVFLACLTLVVFLLPPERPDRTGLGKWMSGLHSCYMNYLF